MGGVTAHKCIALPCALIGHKLRPFVSRPDWWKCERCNVCGPYDRDSRWAMTWWTGWRAQS